MSRKTKKRLSARERGYFPRSEAAASLRQLADSVETGQPGTLVKFTINVWTTVDDEVEPEVSGPAEVLR